jgi:hypothetical protein
VPRPAKLDHLEIPQDYAWNWFSYHASQRMTVFRFFFLVMGVITVGYYQTIEEQPQIALVLSALAAFFSIAFWRLDARTTELIKIGEALLKEIEKKFDKLDLKNAKLVAMADAKVKPFTTRFCPNFFYSYSQVFPAIFAILTISSVVAFICAFQAC